MTKRQTYTAEFKREAVRLLERGDKPASMLALELGIRRNQLYKWQEQLKQRGETAFPGKGRRPNSESQSQRIHELEQELAQTREENAILKKAAAFFARELK